ncbi:hypothetical protein, partial [Staphylococcus haemolyticus]|uniref:hypothetical protein n=1 Tax=Staphylococcus haemolyticus TaxID=1283 RepID=UPI001E644F16
ENIYVFSLANAFTITDKSVKFFFHRFAPFRFERVIAASARRCLRFLDCPEDSESVLDRGITVNGVEIV